MLAVLLQSRQIPRVCCGAKWERSTIPYPVTLTVKERLGLLEHLFVCLGLRDTGVERRGVGVDLPSVSVLHSVIRDGYYYYCKDYTPS